MYDLLNLKDRTTQYLLQYSTDRPAGYTLIRDLWLEVQRLQVDIENIVRWVPIDIPPLTPRQVELFYRKSSKRVLGYWDGKDWMTTDTAAPVDEAPTHYRLLPMTPPI